MTGIIQGLLASIGSAVASAASDAYFNLVTLLLNTSSTNGAQNNTFLDSSTNNFTITRNGNTTQGTFTPFSQTGWSNLFNGSNDYLSIPSATNLQLTTASAFTIEAWVFPTSSLTGSGAKGVVGKRGGTLEWQMYFATGGELAINGTSAFSGGTAVSSVNQWVHVAITWDTTTLRFFINGTLNPNTYTTTFALSAASTNQVVIGATSSGGEFFPGYISNFRMVKGTAVYTSSFTPSTTPLTAITNTQLLTCQSNRFVDNSSNAYTITANNTPSVQAFSPFLPTAAYDTSVVGGSVYFDGSGDFVTVPSNTAFDFAGNATIELWAYWAGNMGVRQDLIHHASNGFEILKLSNDTIYCGFGGGTITSSITVKSGQWYHIALVRSSTGASGLNLYINGVNVGSATAASSVTSGTMAIGAQASGGSSPTIGYFSSLRIVKGTAVYTAAFTPPTAPLTAITNTSLLLSATNAGIFDSAAKNVLETVGNAQVSTTQAKWGTTSMAFDGTGDNLYSPYSVLFPLGTGDFTIEWWMNPDASQVNGSAIFYFTAGSNYFIAHNYLTSYQNLITVFVDNYGAGTRALTGTTSLSSGTWYHVAITRASGTWRLFVNGSLEGSTYSNSAEPVPTNSNLYIGQGTAGYKGYIDDFRITKGYARYTANFTAPTAAFPLQ